MRKRVPAAVLAVLLAWSLAAPALATEEGGTEYVSQDTFWNWAAENTSGLLSAIISYGSESVCTVNEDGRHRASSYNYVKKGFSLSSGVVDEPYYKCVCDACGQEFTAYETDVKQSYDTSVADLPAPVYGADGSIYVVPTIYEIDHLDESMNCGALSNGETKEYNNGSHRVSVNLPLIRFERLKKFYNTKSSCTYGVYFKYKTPFVCTFEVLFSSATYSTNTQSGQLSFYNWSSYYSGGVKYCEASETVAFILVASNLSMIKEGSYDVPGNYIYFFLPDLRFKITPIFPLSDTYNITTRPTSITGGNYGIIGDNGQITTVTNNNQIVNETNNTYYNPATGETSTITDWSYDYSDRSYNLTLEGGDTSTVTYGDENITITETTINESGDTIINNYTIYYIIEDSGSGPATHTHDWRETSVTDAACIQPGKRVYTCDICGDTKSETIPALGHNWLVLRTVNTEYDEDGALVTEGYVLYQCDRCQEQYKTTSTSSRPPPGGGTNSGSGTVLDEFPDFVDMLLEMLQQLPSLFSGFVAFLNAMFAYLPEEIIFMLTFGVAAVVLIGIIKAVRG